MTAPVSAASRRAFSTTARSGAYPGAGVHQRMRHVVAVPDVGDLDPLAAAEYLADRQEVGQRLARVEVIGEPVDHGDGGMACQVDDRLVGERAGHDAVGHPGERAGDVRDAFPLPHRDVRRPQADGVPAKLRHAGLEAHARAQGRLLEDHRQSLLRQGIAVVPRIALDPDGQIQDLQDLVPLQVVNRDEIGALHDIGNVPPPFTRRARAPRSWGGRRSAPWSGAAGQCAFPPCPGPPPGGASWR